MSDANAYLEESRTRTRVAIVNELVDATLGGTIRWSKDEATPAQQGRTLLRYRACAAGHEVTIAGIDGAPRYVHVDDTLLLHVEDSCVAKAFLGNPVAALWSLVTEGPKEGIKPYAVELDRYLEELLALRAIPMEEQEDTDV